jgi:voltage-gated potassium channel Kch
MLVLWMMGAALVMVIAVAAAASVLDLVPPGPDGRPLEFAELVWVTLMHAIDQGTITGDEGPPSWRAIMLAATLLGILMIGGLIGVMVAGVGRLFEDLRKGRSMVLEDGHTLIVGWSRQVFTIVGELARANESRGGGCVVIFAERDKLEMEQALRAKLRETGRTRIVVRAGDPTDPGALAVVSPGTARAIIVLAPEGARGDTQTLRALLAVGRHPAAAGRKQHVVAEIRDVANVAVARLADERRVEALEVGELLAQLSVQTCLQSGLSAVYEELLDFEGDEMYVHAEPALVGKPFAEALQAFADATVMGLRHGDGRVVLNPPMDTAIGADDALVVIARDDDAIHRVTRPPPIDQAAIATGTPAPRAPCRTLILGWGPRGRSIVAGIDAYVEPGSFTLVVADDPAAAAGSSELAPRLARSRLAHRAGDPTDRRVLDELLGSGFDHVLVLSDDRLDDAHEVDARSLATLLHLRDIASRGGKAFSTVSEMRDIRSRDLAQAARPDDFIISDRVLGLLLAQIAENPDLARVFGDLFDPEGSEIYLRPATDYVVLDRPVDFCTVLEAARRRGETALGWRLAPQARQADRDFGVMLNPDRSRRIALAADDRIIVLAPH